MDEKNINKESEESEENKPDLVHREIQCIFGWVDTLNKGELVRYLKTYHQNPNGTKDSLKKRLKYYLRMKKLQSVGKWTGNIKTLFPYYVVLDFEATCNEVNPPDFPHEIIEFPAVLVNTESLTIVDKFQAYVKPVINPELTPFCKSLTGITQEQVDNAAEFPEVLEQFENWLSKHKLGTKNKFAMVTDGPWDMGRFLYGQCSLCDIPFPHFGKKWINLRKCFSIFYKCDRVFHHKINKKKFKLRLQLMLEKLEMKFVGHPHCGLDDATNIAYLLIRMIKDGADIDINEKISLRYKLDRRTTAPQPESANTNNDKKTDNEENAVNDENTANSSNQEKMANSKKWHVKPMHTTHEVH